ncbi:MAG: site-specific tyrosine recombinase/integron integrase [Ruminococcus sp.]|jgi:site-specific recombinase XerD
MKDEIIDIVKSEMLCCLNAHQMDRLDKVLEHVLWDVTVSKEDKKLVQAFLSNEMLLSCFLEAKQLEGCSPKTIKYYRGTISKMFSCINKSAVAITTEDIRKYLSDYQKINNCSKANLDNIRRILSSFFMWLENENYILKSPVRRIHKIRTTKPVKETIADESMEIMRDNVSHPRDLAIIDMLASTGIRVGELCKLNRNDIDFENQECIVLGKGDKERLVYFDARAKVHLRNYLDSRDDDNPALFVSLLKPHKRLEISGVESRLRILGRDLNINKIHPHKFRRTLATKAIDKGMPVEQLQTLLGHSQINTTMEYAIVNQTNVKTSHKKYIA